MISRVLVTGATGFLGLTVVRKLADRGAKVTALTLPGDPGAGRLPAGVRAVCGDVTDRASLERAFEGCGPETCVIHCAGMISIRTTPGKRLWEVNVNGTQNVLELCRQKNIGRLVYVSSVHALPEGARGETVAEIEAFSPERVRGGYARSKAEATRRVLAAAQDGLDACVVHPSGIVGPEDYQTGSMSSMILSYCRGRLPFGVRGGYDFVDVRDVADGILACCERGRAGECYILSGEFVTVRRMLEELARLSGSRPVRGYAPVALARVLAPFAEGVSLLRREKPCLTPYSVAVLASCGRFSHEKAARELGYSPRPFEETLRDAWLFLRREKRLDRPCSRRRRAIPGQ